MPDLRISGALAVTPEGAQALDITVTGGVIEGLHVPGTGPDAARRIDAGGLWLLPGAIDAHTHFTACGPDRGAEVFAGTCGAAAGGVTTVIEMPHGLPPAVDRASLAAKRALCEAHAAVDFALWAGLTGRNAAEIAGLAEDGAVAFKAFLCSPRLDGGAPDETALPAVGDGDLLEAMAEIRAAGSLLGVHSENQDILLAARRRMEAAGRTDMRAHAGAGPEIAELEAVQRLALLAAETGVAAHVVHMSSPRAAEVLARARAAGTDISAETCLHYLLLDEDDLVRIGNVARCGPPLRPAPILAALWEHVLAGGIDMVASDHCPYPPEDKAAGLPVWQAGMGLTGIETNVPLLMSEGVLGRGMPLEQFARMTAEAPARRFGLWPRKGAIRAGADADLTLWDPSGETVVAGAAFRGRAKFSAFEGRKMRGRLVATLSRGDQVFREGRDLGAPGRGRFQRRAGA
ncbi:dihydroorotase family protein [Mangrovicoccus sp. HB161399]|uniref:dihydroorotase n=1 Tax=Mangrovicoccus sp. HB161399 TaxID=2720392 RepID=UPI00155235BE|nr:amidohydrolase family protein [Mangrovicoccus sp. HB161399]